MPKTLSHKFAMNTKMNNVEITKNVPYYTAAMYISHISYCVLN